VASGISLRATRYSPLATHPSLLTPRYSPLATRLQPDPRATLKPRLTPCDHCASIRPLCERGKRDHRWFWHTFRSTRPSVPELLVRVQNQNYDVFTDKYPPVAIAQQHKRTESFRKGQRAKNVGKTTERVQFCWKNNRKCPKWAKMGGDAATKWHIITRSFAKIESAVPDFRSAWAEIRSAWAEFHSAGADFESAVADFH